ncbi:uncharacterized protein AMSG_06349 [Thecamonas trahens ATCC 50062]|uniref:Uncharacterized protein n=1 Tax=Thecamonas trahens ATCC 50062 TaxID=461836 RepID=A0A0L0DDA9_THETB|nr:hypothetical protein AMSG_06349 [Thecamonas trahens ATCC 50062]KNC50205.1 hypothetical protein AMSG_06349 [Thecamonas trahens ATCC 50062]|eukprot:XP_013757040.1 hypothetical protein AMSG_06349 [Thecamonas trahens ATCC 50062]
MESIAASADATWRAGLALGVLTAIVSLCWYLVWHYFLVRSPFVRELLEYDDLPQSRQTQADTDSGSGTGAGPGETDKIKSS